MGLSGAGGGAAPNLQSVGVDPISETSQAQDSLSGSGGGGLGAGSFGAVNGAIQGLMSGTPTGYLGAAANLGKLGAQYTGNAALGSAGGYLGSALNIYGGIQQGGVAGDTKAGLGAASLGAQAGAFGGYSAAVGAAAGALSIGLAPALIGMSTPPYSLTPKYWDKVNSSANSLLSTGINDSNEADATATLNALTNGVVSPGEQGIAGQLGSAFNQYYGNLQQGRMANSGLTPSQLIAQGIDPNTGNNIAGYNPKVGSGMTHNGASKGAQS